MFQRILGTIYNIHPQLDVLCSTRITMVSLANFDIDCMSREKIKNKEEKFQ